MEVSVLNIKGAETGRKVSLNDAIYAIEPNDHALYLDVKLYLANQRQGTAKTKERSEMSGSTRKLGRQKGGGGARRGDINSPVRRWCSRFRSHSPRLQLQAEQEGSPAGSQECAQLQGSGERYYGG